MSYRCISAHHQRFEVPVVNNKHQQDKPLLMGRYMTVFYILF